MKYRLLVEFRENRKHDAYKAKDIELNSPRTPRGKSIERDESRFFFMQQ